MADDKERMIVEQTGVGEENGGTGNGKSNYGAHESTTVLVADTPKSNGNDKTSGKTDGSKEKQTKDDVSPSPEKKKFRNNRYATKKTAGQGLLGVSLLTSNTALLKSTLDHGPESDYYYLLLTLISLSLFFQVIDGILLMIIGSRESKLDCDSSASTKYTEKLNDYSTLIIFVITMLNASLGAFTINPGETENSIPMDLANVSLSTIF